MNTLPMCLYGSCSAEFFSHTYNMRLTHARTTWIQPNCSTNLRAPLVCSAQKLDSVRCEHNHVLRDQQQNQSEIFIVPCVMRLPPPMWTTHATHHFWCVLNSPGPCWTSLFFRAIFYAWFSSSSPLLLFFFFLTERVSFRNCFDASMAY